MVQLGTLLKVTDSSGAIVVQCIKVLSSGSKRIAYLGDVVLVSVKSFDVKEFSIGKMKNKKRRKFSKGSLSRALVVRTKINFSRGNGVFIKFDENAVVLVNKRVVPISNRISGPVLKEICMKWPSFGCVTRFII